MISQEEYIILSLENHLFFARIMKEHSFFLQVSFTPRDAEYVARADNFRKQFDELLKEVISLSNGVVSKQVLDSGEIITPFTLEAEKVSSFYTGVQLATELTEEEAGLTGYKFFDFNSENFVYKVDQLNNTAISLIISLIQFKNTVLSNVLSCQMFTYNYPSLLQHIIHEAQLYLNIINLLQKKQSINFNPYEQEAFWDHIMAEHSKFIHGLLDPSEEFLIQKAEFFGEEFDMLAREAMVAIDSNDSYNELKYSTIHATKELRNFKEQGTEGLLACKIKGLILPLLADHTLREANHYLRLLES